MHTQVQETRIESRALWGLHKAAFNKAIAAGACWDCATRAGFAATDSPRTEAEPCTKCRRRGVRL